MRGFVLETVAWSAVACAVWLATLSSITLPETCFAIAAAIPCGILARASRRALDASWSFRPQWLAWPALVLVTLVAEVVQLFGTEVVRPRSGRIATLDLPEEEPTLASGRTATATLALCSTPGSLVADNDPARHRLTVHTLLSAGPDLRSVVRR
jgi:hypothetical protein